MREDLGHRSEPGKLSLLVIGDGYMAMHPLPTKGRVTVGRAIDCEVQIDDPSISRRHCLIELGDDTTVEDLGSANGTRVREERLDAGQRRPVTLGESVYAGPFLLMVQPQRAPVHARRLWPHDYFEGRLTDECARAAEDRDTFALLRIRTADGDRDAPLHARFADVLRPQDVLGAYGPGECEVLLSKVTPVEAREVATRVRDRFHEGRTAIGLACYPRDGQNAHELIQHANPVVRAEISEGEPAIVVEDPRMKQLYELVERVAKSDLTVLLLGETGVGKEVVAEAVHRCSPRAGKPFLRLNCAALTETLLESELFGHEQGAFTGAMRVKSGLLETAEGGTVFLDEIGELPMSIQVTLLRVLEERMVLRVGGLKPRPIDVRFVAATNRDLDAEIARGAFRSDLYFRLSGITTSIPPLRERVAEIRKLAEVFIAQSSRNLGFSTAPRLSLDSLTLLQTYWWPGNIRELRNVMERAVVLCTGDTIEAEHLPVEKMKATFGVTPGGTGAAPRAAGPNDTAPSNGLAPSPAPTDARDEDSILDTVRRETERYEKQRILEALAQARGNQTEAAKLLGVSRRTLVRRLDVYEIARPRKKK